MKKAGCWLLLATQILVILGFWHRHHWGNPQADLLAGTLAYKYLAWGRLAGLLAVAGILFQVLLIGRVKWIEQLYGLDKLARLHSIVGLCIVVLLVAHPMLVTAGHALYSDSTRYEQFKDFSRNWPDVLQAVIATDIMAIVIVTSAVSLLTRRLKYEIWYAIHLSIYVAIALAFGHQLEAGADFVGNKAFTAYWYALYAFVFGNLAYYRVLRPLISFVRHRFAVTGVTAETKDVTSVTIGGRDLARFRMEAGQFLMVRFLAPGFRWESHPFSLSRKPDGQQIRLTMKQLGDYTRRIPQLQPGTRVFIDGPHGVFTSAKCRPGNVLMIAGGIGITPLRALAEEMLAAGRDIVFLYANRTSDSIVFRDELDLLSRESAGRFRVVHVLSQDKSWPGDKGYIDAELISRHVPDLAARDIYLCGPPPMMKIVRTHLRKLGVPGSRVHYERFAL